MREKGGKDKLGRTRKRKVELTGRGQLLFAPWKGWEGGRQSETGGKKQIDDEVSEVKRKKRNLVSCR